MAHPHPDLAVDTRSETSHPYWHEIRTIGAHPHRRSCHSAVAWNSQMIICGGQDLREGMVPGVWTFSQVADRPELDTWQEEEGNEAAPPPLCRHSAVVDGNQMIIFGGTDNSSESANTFIQDLNTRAWTVKLPEEPGLPPPIDSHSAVVNNHCMVIFAGFVGGSRSNHIFVLDLGTMKWSSPPVSGALPSPRSGHSAVSYQGNMIVFAGCGDDGIKFNDLWRLSLTSYVWERVELVGNVPQGRSGHSAIVYRHWMIIFGGVKDLTKETNEMYGFNLDTLQWHLLQEERTIEDPVSAVQLEEYKKGKFAHSKSSHSPSPSPSTAGHKPHHESPNILGKKHDSPISPEGESSSGKKRKAHLYDGPASPVLGRIVGRAPYPRDGHSAVLIGDKMFIFGGDRYQMPFNDLYVFALNDHSVRPK